MFTDGYIKLHRSVLEWEWYDDPNTFKVFMHLLLNAQINDTLYHGVNIPRGSYASSVRNLAEETSLSQREIRTSLNRLKSTQSVTQLTTQCKSAKFSVFTVVNFEKFQGCDTVNDKVNDTVATQWRHSPSNEKERKKERKEKIKESIEIKYLNYNKGFDAFWQSYPRKVNKQAALKAWQKISPDGELESLIISALETHKLSEQWTHDNGKYIPYPATWLNGRRWEDETTEEKQEGVQIWT